MIILLTDYSDCVEGIDAVMVKGYAVMSGAESSLYI